MPYIVSGIGGILPVDLAERLAELAGWPTCLVPELGLALVFSAGPGFAGSASTIPGVEAVERDLPLLDRSGGDARALRFPARQAAAVACRELAGSSS
ncbi:MAG: hypothetical protein ICV87_03395 [Gemmatimonadetes bacterium]|nr:hypothetical protein [Gemmatimonadota bacterium]